MSQVSIIDIEGNHPQIPTEFVTDDGTAIPIANTLEILGTSVPAGVIPVETTGSGNTVTIEVQTSAAILASDASRIGLAAFDSDAFTVDANGFVSLIGGGAGIETVATDVGGPVSPDGAGQISILADIAASTGVPIYTDGTVANTVTIKTQLTSAQVGSILNRAGLASFDSAAFSVDGNGFVTLLGGTEAIDSIGVDATSGGGTNPVLPTVAGLVTVNGARVAASTTPVRTVSTAANVYQVQVQTSQALAATDATKVGLANFDSARFTCDANGFVSANGSGLGETITGDSGGALNPSSGNWNILGLSGSKTSGSGSTLTVKSPPFSQVGSSATSALNTGEFVTAAVTRTVPASAGLADGDLFIYVCTTAGALVIQSVGAQKIRIGALISGAAGTATSTAIGDSLTLRFNATDGFLYAISVIGTWVLA